MARVPSVDTADLPEEYRYLFEENELGTLDLFRALGNNPPILQSYMRWGTTLWRECGLDEREVELVILAVACELDAAYEWHQHVPIGVDAGIATDDLRALRDGDFDRLDDGDALLVEYATAVVRGTVEDTIHDRLRDRFDDETITGVVMLATHYLATARALDALGVEPEGEFVGWDLENLDSA